MQDADEVIITGDAPFQGLRTELLDVMASGFDYNGIMLFRFPSRDSMIHYVVDTRAFDALQFPYFTEYSTVSTATFEINQFQYQHLSLLPDPVGLQQNVITHDAIRAYIGSELFSVYHELVEVSNPDYAASSIITDPNSVIQAIQTVSRKIQTHDRSIQEGQSVALQLACEEVLDTLTFMGQDQDLSEALMIQVLELYIELVQLRVPPQGCVMG